MEPQKRLIERREHPRYYPDRKNQPKVNFVFNGDDRVPVEVLNISKGGLFGYTSGINQFIKFTQSRINMIEICFPEKIPFCCSGKLLRVQPTREQNKCFCAIALDQIGINDKRTQINVASEIEQAHRPRKKILIHEQKFIDRLKKADNYFHIKDKMSSAIVRRKVYDSFDDVTLKLTLEEKWCFFEIVDELKRREPECPDNLKNAFLDLCRTGLKQSLDQYHEFIFSVSEKKF